MAKPSSSSDRQLDFVNIEKNVHEPPSAQDVENFLKRYVAETKPSELLKQFRGDSFYAVLKRAGAVDRDKLQEVFSEDGKQEFRKKGTVTYRHRLTAQYRSNITDALFIAQAEDVLESFRVALDDAKTVKAALAAEEELLAVLRQRLGLSAASESATKKKKSKAQLQEEANEKQQQEQQIIELARQSTRDLSLDKLPDRDGKPPTLACRTAAAHFVLNVVNGSKAAHEEQKRKGDRYNTLEDHAKIFKEYDAASLRQAVPEVIRTAAYTGDMSVFLRDYEKERERDAQRKRKEREAKAINKKKGDDQPAAPPSSGIWESINSVHQLVVRERRLDPTLDGPFLNFSITLVEEILAGLKEKVAARAASPPASEQQPIDPAAASAAAAASSSSSSSGRQQLH